MTLIIYNTIKKTYPSGLFFNKKYPYNIIVGRTFKNRNVVNRANKEIIYRKLNLKKRREKIQDIALSNEWQYFVTFTFDSKDYSHELARKHLKNFIDVMRRKYPNMKYLLVAEYMKKSKQLHFHGLFSNVTFTLQPSINQNPNSNLYNKVIPGLYNILDYKHGYNTLTMVQNSEKVSRYITKYITKDLLEKEKEKKVFWYSKNCIKPKIEKVYLLFTPSNYKTFDNGYSICYNEIS